MLILVATVTGAKVYTAQDDTTTYWSLGAAVTVGDQVTPDDLVPVRAHLSSAVASSYLAAENALPARLADLVWTRDVAAGALLERSALAVATTRDSVGLPLNVANGSFPAGIGRGDRVDVWVGPAPGQPEAEGAARVLAAVRVESAGGGDVAASGAASRTIMVSVAEADLTPDAMSAVSARHVTLVRLP